MVGTRKVILLVTVCCLAGIFGYAGVIKLVHPDSLLSDIQGYHLLPYRFAYLGALFLPALEIITASGLLLSAFRRESSFILSILMLFFLVALTSAWARGLDISCGCFGKSETQANYPLLLARDLLLLVACLFVFTYSKRKR